MGIGGIFRGAHLPAYPNIREAELVSLCDVSESALREAQRITRKVYLDRARRAEEDGDEDLYER
ncbi:MAG: hypothetical protein DRN68_01695, partial [Thaumarchaeota archaeon]